MKLATQLIESISSDTFDAKAYHDEYRQRVLDLIKQKSKGKMLKLSAKAPKPATGVVDLMQRLKDSVAQTVRRKGARSRPILAQVPHAVPKKANAGRR
jgi:DNA end-binding protein Ku